LESWRVNSPTLFWRADFPEQLRGGLAAIVGDRDAALAALTLERGTITWQSSPRTPDGDGSLLVHMVLMYGYGMADGNAHAPSNLPILVLGGGGGALKGGRHLKFPADTPLANLHLTLLDKLAVPIDTIGDNNGRANLDRLSGV